jgi:hypothetical protein
MAVLEASASGRLWRFGVATCLALPLLGVAPTALSAEGSCSGVEYRLEARAGEAAAPEVPKWDGRSSRRLAASAFLDASDIRSIKLRPSRPFPGRWDIELSHRRSGARKFAALEDADRARQFAIVVGGQIVQVFAFAPNQRDLYDEGISAGAFPKDVAERLQHEIEQAIDACS